MRLLFALLALTLAVVAVAASTMPISTTQIDKLSYELVKGRQPPNEFPLFIPAVAYRTEGEIQVIVFAIPYNPGDAQSIQLLNTLVLQFSKLGRDPYAFDSAIETLKRLRNVYFPYETFRIKLIFVIFVKTKTLTDLGIGAVQELIKEPKQGDKAKAASYFTSAIIMLMSKKYKPVSFNDLKYQVSLEQRKINYVNTPDKEVEVDIKNNKYKIKIHCTAYDKEGKCVMGELSGNIVYDVKIGDREKIEEAVKFDFNIKVSKQYDKYIISSCDLKWYFLDNNKIDKIKNNIGVYLNYAKSRALKAVEEMLPNMKELNRVLGNVPSDKLTGFSTKLNKSIKYYFSTMFESKLNNQLNLINSKPQDGSLCRFIDWVIDELNGGSSIRNIIKDYIEEIWNKYTEFLSEKLSEVNSENEKMLNAFSNALKTNLKNALKDENVVDQVFNSISSVQVDGRSYGLNDIAGVAVSALLDSALDSVKGCLIDAVQKAFTEAGEQIISSLPVAGQIYALINGVLGALQNYITIDGSVMFENTFGNGKILPVNGTKVCLPGVAIQQNQAYTFISSPNIFSLGVLKGFLAGLVKTYTADEVGGVIDVFPIVREFDVPSDAETGSIFFMIPSEPGIYNVTILFNVKSLLDQIKNSIKTNVKNVLSNLDKSVTEIRCSKPQGRSDVSYDPNSLRGTISCVIIDSGIINNIQTKQNAQLTASGQAGGGNDKMKISTFIISFPPYAYGIMITDNVYRFNYSYDWFGFFRKKIYDVIGGVRTTSHSVCSSANTMSNPTTPNQNIVNNWCNTFSDFIVNNIKTYINNVIEQNLAKYKQFECKGRECCSLTGIIKQSASSTVKKLSEDVLNGLLNYLKGEITRSCTLLVSNVGQRVGDLRQYVGDDRLLSFISSGVGTSGDGDNSLVCAIQSWLGYLATPLVDVVADYMHVPSYLLAGFSLRPPESDVVQTCYSVVVSPYFVYRQTRLKIDENNLPQVLLKYSEVLAYTSAGKPLFEILSTNPVKISLWLVEKDYYWFKFENNEYKACQLLFTLGFVDYTKCNSYNNLAKFYVSEDYRRYIGYLMGKREWFEFLVKLPSPREILSHRNFNTVEEVLANIAMDRRNVTLPYLGGVNAYFTAFKVYPAIAVRERLDDLNAYYMVIPYSAPARELFVLGTVGNYVIYDGEPKRSDNKPFLYVDLVRGSGR